ncbi:MAG: hypothetical protein ACLFNW_10005 [Desulfobacterales bacterium]
MKKEQVPQDNENLMEGRAREVCYAVDEDGRYVQAWSTGWGPKNAAMLQAWDQVNEEAKEAFDQVMAGRASPLAYFMAKGMFDVSLLSAYTKIPKRKIKSHLVPEKFRRIDEKTLGKYAEAFGITPEELVNGPETVETFPGEK